MIEGEPRAWKLFARVEWAPICWAEDDEKKYVKPFELHIATRMSVYAALCLVYPDVIVRGGALRKLQASNNGQLLVDYERAPDRTQEQVVALLRAVNV